MWFDESSPPPRDPDRYEWSAHLRDDVLDSRMRFLTEDMVQETISDGRDHWDEGRPAEKFPDRARNDASTIDVRRKRDFDGVDAVLVIPRDEPILVTGWTEIGDYPRAFASDRWLQGEIARIQAFEDKRHLR